jgi:hypothetical protein
MDITDMWETGSMRESASFWKELDDDPPTSGYPLRTGMIRERCARKMVILDEIKAAMDDLTAIHDSEVEALLAEDLDELSSLGPRLQRAQAHKASLVEQYREHVTTHGC